ncbi:MAG TPA: metalloregulator ArsR/SmtB family transcription factor [Sphingomonas sp.]|nr:metalloregulator ArsR/SmtB family transcription factor [Sphingomonas sp.]
MARFSRLRGPYDAAAVDRAEERLADFRAAMERSAENRVSCHLPEAARNTEWQKSAKNHSTNGLNVQPPPIKLNHMVEQRLDAVFHALSDPTRRGMLAQLALGEKSVGALAEPWNMSFAGASKHVKVLEGAGLIARRKAGRTQICRLEAAPLAEAGQWLRQWEQFWAMRLDLLETLVTSKEEDR